jgi:hypothetical protein
MTSLRDLHNIFNPSEALQAGDPKYVNCENVRGEGDIQVNLGRKLEFAEGKTCYLYSGHRGTGKSTELLRLKKYLEDRDFYVVYFAADEEDIQSEETQYTDILLACTRHLLQDLSKSADAKPILTWLKTRLQELKDLAQMEVSLDAVNLEVALAQFAKVTANLRTDPTLRQRVREKVNPYTVSLIDILNEFLRNAKKKLPENRKRLAMIVDNLDRIVPIVQESGRTNHEEIFIDRCEQLKALDCHLVYTVPISLIYSQRANDLQNIYGICDVLPMLMVQNSDETIHAPGLEKLKEIIQKRVNLVASNLSLDTGDDRLFEDRKTWEKLCLMSGGHLRNLLLLIQEAIVNSNSLPISARAVQIAINKVRQTLRISVNHEDWQLLAQVARSKQILAQDQYRKLLFNRCLLEYHYWDYDEEGELKLQYWYDVHPLLKAVQELKDAIAKLPVS